MKTRYSCDESAFYHQSLKTPLQVSWKAQNPPKSAQKYSRCRTQTLKCVFSSDFVVDGRPVWICESAFGNACKVWRWRGRMRRREWGRSCLCISTGGAPGLERPRTGTLSSSPPLARAGHPRCVWKGGWSAGRVGVAGAGAARLRVLAGAAEGGKVQRGTRGSPKLAPPLTRSFLRFECIPWELISALGSWIRRH